MALVLLVVAEEASRTESCPGPIQLAIQRCSILAAPTLKPFSVKPPRSLFKTATGRKLLAASTMESMRYRFFARSVRG